MRALARGEAPAHDLALVVAEMLGQLLEHRRLLFFDVAFEKLQQHLGVRLPFVGLGLAAAGKLFEQVIEHPVLDIPFVGDVGGVLGFVGAQERVVHFPLFRPRMRDESRLQLPEQRPPFFAALRFVHVPGELEQFVVILPQQRPHIGGVHRRRLEQQFDFVLQCHDGSRSIDCVRKPGRSLARMRPTPSTSVSPRRRPFQPPGRWPSRPCRLQRRYCTQSAKEPTNLIEQP